MNARFTAIVLALSSISSSALAQSSSTEPETTRTHDLPYQAEFSKMVMPKRYDFDRGSQLLWGSVGGVAGIVALPLFGLTAVRLSETLCPDYPDDDMCQGAIFASAIGVGAASFASAPLLAINMTGGRRADSWTHTASVFGTFLGLTIGGLPFSIIASRDGIPDAPGQREAFFIGSYALIGAAAGLGGALFYQLSYPEPRLRRPIVNVSIAPMITSEGHGLALTGRF